MLNQRLSLTIHELAARVDIVEQTQQALSGRLDADLTAVREDITRVTAANRDSLNQRSLQDSRQIIVRGIPRPSRLSLYTSLLLSLLR